MHRSRSALLLLAAGATALAAATQGAVATGGPTAAGHRTGRPLGVSTDVLTAPASMAHPGDSTGSSCLTPDHAANYSPLHCYTPSQIDQAYGLNAVHSGLNGTNQTIVLVDAYGSPTASHDIDHFAKTFNLPTPHFREVYPLGKPDYSNAKANDQGLSGPAAAAGWAGEATLDIEWADAVAPTANIVLLATPPAETLGVQGLPNLMKAIHSAVDSYPAGTVFSMSFGTDEADFGGAAKTQFARFDKTFAYGLAHGDTFFSSAGDSGTTAALKQHKESATGTTPSVSYPNVSPYVTSVGGTQLQYGWTWAPTSNTPFTANGFNPGYFASTAVGNHEPVWNESWLPAATGGGASTVYPRPSWQSGVALKAGNHRLVPDVSWNAAVNGGVLVYETYPAAWTSYSGAPAWQPVGGTSAASPQVAALTALANEQRAKDGDGPIGWLNPLLYGDSELGASATPSATGSGAFRDIVPQIQGSAASGKLVNNTLWQYNADGSVSPGPVPGHATRTGYDLTTGFGSPRGPGYVSALAAAKPVPAP